MPSPEAGPIVEFRRYTLHPGHRDELVDLFEREFVEPQEAAGIALIGSFRDARRPDRFTWLRAFEDMASRRASLAAFYEGPCLRRHRDAANATMQDSDNVLLLRPATAEHAAMPSGRFRGPLLAASYLFGGEDEARAFSQSVAAAWSRVLNSDGGRIVSILASEDAENTYPKLPVREGEHAVVLLVEGLEPERIPASPAPEELAMLVPPPRSKIQLARIGARGDFDFERGAWSVLHRRLRSRLCGSSDWITETGTCVGYALAGGVLSVDEFDFPSTGTKACSVRSLDPAAQRWTIHWTTSERGGLLSPVHGGFDGETGVFFGYDVEGVTPVLTRFIWSGTSGAQPSWEQAFSTDGGASWETNWTMQFSRAREIERAGG